MRVLFVCPFPPSSEAPAGGPKEAGRLIHAMSELCEVRGLCLRDPSEDPVGRELIDAGVPVDEISRGSLVHGRVRRLSRAPRVATGWMRGRPRAVTAMAVGRFADRLNELDRDWKPDVVHFEHVHSAYFIDAVQRPVPRVIRVLEPAAETARELARLKPPLQRLPALVDAAVWKRFEGRAFAAADALVALTERDESALVTAIGTLTPVFLSGLTPVDPGPVAEYDDADDRTVAFVANFAHGPNIDAARLLVDEIVPLVRAEAPDARLLLVGEGSSALQQLPPWAVATGRVVSIASALEQVAVVALPLRVGGGMRVKAVEALGLGKPVVATPLAAAGLTVVDGREIVFAETADGFAKALTALLGDRPRRRQLGAAAQAWARAEARASDRVQELLRFYEALAAANRDKVG